MNCHSSVSMALVWYELQSVGTNRVSLVRNFLYLGVNGESVVWMPIVRYDWRQVNINGYKMVWMVSVCYEWQNVCLNDDMLV